MKEMARKIILIVLLFIDSLIIGSCIGPSPGDLIKESENALISQKNKIEAESKVNIDIANQKLEEYLSYNYGEFAPKVFDYKYIGVVANDPGYANSIPSFGYRGPGSPTTYSKYKYSLNLFFINESYEVYFSIDNYQYLYDTFNARYPSMTPVDEFKQYVLNKCELNDLPISDIVFYINYQDIYFSNYDTNDNYKKYVMDNVPIEYISNIVFENIKGIDEINVILDVISLKLPKLINVIRDIRNLQFVFNMRNDNDIFTVHFKSIDNNYIIYEITKDESNEDIINQIENVIYKSSWEGVYNSNINESNYLLLFKQLLLDNDKIINYSPIDNNAKNNALKIANEFKSYNTEIIAYLSDYEKRTVVFLLQNGKRIEKRSIVFSLSKENIINDIHISENLLMVDDNGNKIYEKYYDMLNNPGEVMFYVTNPKFVTSDIVLALTTNFSFEYASFMNKGILNRLKYKVAVVQKKYGTRPYEYGIRLLYDNTSINNYIVKNLIKNDVFLNGTIVGFSSSEGLSNSIINDYNENFNSDFKSVEEVFDDFKNIETNKIFNYGMPYYITNKNRMKEYNICYHLCFPARSGDYWEKDEDKFYNTYDIKDILAFSRIGNLLRFGKDTYWQVAKKDENKVLLVDASFNCGINIVVNNGTVDYEKDVLNYETSFIRKYLNKEFVRIFNDNEYGLVLETNLVNNNMGRNTKDKVFILSEAEYNSLENTAFNFVPQNIYDNIANKFLEFAIRDKSSNSNYLKIIRFVKSSGFGKMKKPSSFWIQDGIFNTSFYIQPAMWVKFK